MITYVKGNIFDSPSKIIVNTVNTVGVMGKGVALEYKKRYPKMFERYVELCEASVLDIGNIFLWKESEKWVLLFPTKKHWRNPSRMEYIEAGLRKIAEKWDKLGSNSIAFPRLGCGNGGLEWKEVQPLMEKYLGNIPMEVIVYVDKYDDPIPEHENVTEIEQWLSGESELVGYEAFRKKIERYIWGNSAITFEGENYQIEKKDEIIYIGEEQVDEEMLCNMWNWTRDVGIIELGNIPYEFNNVFKVVLEMMHKIEYVAKVFVSKDGINFPDRPNAYQYRLN